MPLRQRIKYKLALLSADVQDAPYGDTCLSQTSQCASVSALHSCSVQFLFSFAAVYLTTQDYFLGTTSPTTWKSANIVTAADFPCLDVFGVSFLALSLAMAPFAAHRYMHTKTVLLYT